MKMKRFNRNITDKTIMNSNGIQLKTTFYEIGKLDVKDVILITYRSHLFTLKLKFLVL